MFLSRACATGLLCTLIACDQLSDMVATPSSPDPAPAPTVPSTGAIPPPEPSQHKPGKATVEIVWTSEVEAEIQLTCPSWDAPTTVTFKRSHRLTVPADEKCQVTLVENPDSFDFVRGGNSYTCSTAQKRIACVENELADTGGNIPPMPTRKATAHPSGPPAPEPTR